jgi:hypothetical protein
MTLLQRLGEGPAGPIKLAVALAIVSIPLVGLSFLLPPLFEADPGFSPPEILPAFVIAGLATVGAAIAGGGVGGLVVRTRPTIGALLALAIAWPLAVSLVSIAATLLKVPFETAYSCFDTCGPTVHSRDAASGAGMYLISTVISILTIVPPIIAAICLFGAYKLNQGGSPFVATIVLAIGYGALDYLAFLAGAQPILAYLCLAAGVALWTRVLRSPSGTLSPP